MNIVKLIRNTGVGLLTTALMAFALAAPAFASGGDNCVIIYGVEFCSEKTPFVIGNFIISDEVMALMLLIFAAMFVMVVNAVHLKGKVKTLENRA